MTVWYRPINPGGKRGKSFLVKAGLKIMGRALKSASQHDPVISRELEAWTEGQTVGIRVRPSGPYIRFQKRGDRLVPIKPALGKIEAGIEFRNLDAVLLVLRNRMGFHQAFAQRRMRLFGDPSMGVTFVRILCALQICLFPGSVQKRILKNIPDRPAATAAFRIWLYSFGILFGI